MNRLNWQFAIEGLKSPVFKTAWLVFGIGGSLAGIFNWVNASAGFNILSVPGNLLVICFCAIVLAAAHGIVLWKCPKDIRKYGSKEDYIEKKLPDEIITASENKAGTVYSHKEAFRSKTISEFLVHVENYELENDPAKKAELKIKQDAAAEPHFPKAVRAKVAKDWDKKFSKGSIASRVCSVLVILAFCGFGFVFVVNLFNLINYATNS